MTATQTHGFQSRLFSRENHYYNHKMPCSSGEETQVWRWQRQPGSGAAQPLSLALNTAGMATTTPGPVIVAMICLSYIFFEQCFPSQ